MTVIVFCYTASVLFNIVMISLFFANIDAHKFEHNDSKWELKFVISLAFLVVMTFSTVGAYKLGQIFQALGG